MQIPHESSQKSMQKNRNANVMRKTWLKKIIDRKGWETINE